MGFLPKAYATAELLDGEMASQLRRAALSINLNIADRSLAMLPCQNRLDGDHDDPVVACA